MMKIEENKNNQEILSAFVTDSINIGHKKRSEKLINNMDDDKIIFDF